MSFAKLDRTQWTWIEAREHVEAVLAVETASPEDTEADPALMVGAYPWRPQRDPVELRREAAQDQLLVALRDGDLHATGRKSTTRDWSAWAGGVRWRLHSGHYQPISPADWREGEFDAGRLSSLAWEFIDIRLPRFMVKAIWPAPEATVPTPPGEGVAYTTPYLRLMQEAIARFDLSDAYQAKKDNLVDWFLDQEVDGEPLSRNLAEAMATLIRLPSAQRGGAKRCWSPTARAS